MHNRPVALHATLPRFNGKLFKEPEVLPLTRYQIELLREAARSDWQFVEPAIRLWEHDVKGDFAAAAAARVARTVRRRFGTKA